MPAPCHSFKRKHIPCSRSCRCAWWVRQWQPSRRRRLCVCLCIGLGWRGRENPTITNQTDTHPPSPLPTPPSLHYEAQHVYIVPAALRVTGCGRALGQQPSPSSFLLLLPDPPPPRAHPTLVIGRTDNAQARADHGLADEKLDSRHGVMLLVCVCVWKGRGGGG